MKNLFTLIAFTFLIGTIHAQDSIFKTNGNVVAAKILEISSTEIKYKKYQFLDGPTYVENKTSIRSIKYSNGLKEDFAPAPAPQAVQTPQTIAPPTETGADYYSKQNDTYKQTKLEYSGTYFLYNNRKMGENTAHSMLLQTKDKDIINLVQQSKDAHALKFVGFGAIPLGIGALYFLAQSISYTNNVNSAKLATSGLCLIGAIACPIVSGIYSKKRRIYNQEAVKLYNERY
ncbi:MAG: hypothetical protein JWP12_3401 [Bacteroidetes bacterium]|nr:hypothetical protein [Bacteroidota bacterium]